MGKKRVVKVYDGFGHTHDMVVYGHVFNHRLRRHRNSSTNMFANIIELIRLFIVKPLADVPVKLDWEGQMIQTTTASDGFFKLEWTANREAGAGFHSVKVEGAEKDYPCEPGIAEIFIPHSTQFAFITDVDDTVLVSHSYTRLRRLRELMFNKPHSRLVFKDVAKHYQLLAHAHTVPQEPNPFFYVSSSEWNLYDYLRDFFSHNDLPRGALLLSQVKRWYQLFKTGKTKHEGKLTRILRVLTIFPKQRFVLFGDNSQLDPAIYASLSEKYADRIFAVYIRNVNPKNEASARSWLNSIEGRGVHTCLFRESSEAIEHSRTIGLID